VTNQIILSFLKAGLVDIGGDDAKLERLKAASLDLAESLKESPAKAIQFALVALDPKVPENDLTVQIAAQALEKRWATYSNTFAALPITVLRAILLESLAISASESDEIGVILVALTRNELSYMEAGNETTIWSELISEIELRIDDRAVREWTVPDRIETPRGKYPAPPAIEISQSAVTFDKTVLARSFEGTVGPNAGNRATGGNQFWPQNNAQWSEQFGIRFADALVNVFEKYAEASKMAPIDLAPSFKALANAVSSQVDATISAVTEATSGLQRRTNLIWWKESLYSPSSRISYRKMSPYMAAMLMAFDLSSQVPLFSPASVVALLHEAVLTLPGVNDVSSRTIRELMVEASELNDLAQLRAVAAEMFPSAVDRVPVLGLMNPANNYVVRESADFQRRVGVPATAALSAPEWASWVFRELQAGRAAKTPGLTSKATA
jgi:hypothetical protein